MSADDSILTDRLTAAGSVEEIHKVCGDIAEALGFDFFLYGVRIPVSLTRPYQFILSGYPAEWRQRYDAEHYSTIDPTIHYALSSLLPASWGQIDCESPQVRQLFREAADFGLKDGITVPVHGNAGEVSLLNFAGRQSLPAGKTELMALLRRAQWFATHVHETTRCVALSKEPVTSKPTELTDRETECLRWSSEGKTAWEISRILSISERTVVFHLQNAARKMGVHSRSHAICRAITHGLITPVGYPARLDRSQHMFERVDH